MSISKLPERASLEYLRKLAKTRLQQLRTVDPDTKLADAQLLIAREHGFASWRALKAQIDSRQARRPIASPAMRFIGVSNLNRSIGSTVVSTELCKHDSHYDYLAN